MALYRDRQREEESQKEIREPQLDETAVERLSQPELPAGRPARRARIGPSRPPRNWSTPRRRRGVVVPGEGDMPVDTEQGLPGASDTELVSEVEVRPKRRHKAVKKPKIRRSPREWLAGLFKKPLTEDDDAYWGGPYRVRRARVAAYAVIASAVTIAGLAALAYVQTRKLPNQFDQIVERQLQPLQGRAEYQNQLAGFLGDAQLKAAQYATACLNVVNEQRDAQTDQLRAIGAPDCGWGGRGTLQIMAPIVGANLGWPPTTQRAVVGVMVQPAGQPLWLTYYVPFFTTDGKTAKFAGAGALFGSRTQVSHVLADDRCDGSDFPDIDLNKLQAALSSFMSAMTGDLSIDSNLLMAPGVSYEPFDRRRNIDDEVVRLVSEPKVKRPQLCEYVDDEFTLVADVTLKGPGSSRVEFTMPYAFRVEHVEAGGSRVFRVKAWGPNTATDVSSRGGG